MVTPLGTRKKRSRKTGLPPGSLVHVGEQRTERPEVTLFHYTETSLEEKRIENIEECFPYKEKPGVTWINIDGVHNVELIEKFGNNFELHPLTLEDILNTEQRPKQEDFGNYIYVVLKMFHYAKNGIDLVGEQLSIIIGNSFVLSFQEEEREGDVFQHVRGRIRNDKSRIRKSGADYLAYALLDSVVDYYFPILEKIGEEIEALEVRTVDSPTPEVLPLLYSLKRRMLYLRRSIWPLREVLGGLEREENTIITRQTALFLKDVHDHSVQIIDTIETFREMLSSMLDIYLSSVSNRMNSVMKVLTIIATIFMPLTFIVGIYGMNFEYMPELKWKLGYPLTWLVMASVTSGMLVYFRKKDWI